MKRDKLYTVNKWNKRLFAVGGYQGLQPMQGVGFGLPNFSAPDLSGVTIPGVDELTGLDIGRVNPLQHTMHKLGSFAESSVGGAAIGALGSAVGGIGNKLLSNGLSSGAGEAVSDIGGAVGGAVSMVNPVLGGIISAGSGVLGGGINALVGTDVDQGRLDAANAGTNYLMGFNSNASSFDGVQGPVAQAAVEDAYSGGVFKKSWARRKNDELKRQRQEANLFAQRSVDNNIFNISENQIDNMLANYSAGGGEIHIKPENRGKFTALKERTGHSATWFKENGTPAQRKMATFALNARKWKHGDGGYLMENHETQWPVFMQDGVFAFGGDMEAHGGDFGTGLVHVSEGMHHEENPYGGVQMGVDSQNVPNLVEEGEVVFDDYVYSDRIQIDAETKEKFHIGNKKEMTYAELAKKLENEIKERPNDPISRKGFEAQMHDLAEEQERQKREMEAEKAREAFEALSDEEKVAVMNSLSERQNLSSQSEEGGMNNEETVNARMAEEGEALGTQTNIPDNQQMGMQGGEVMQPNGETLGTTAGEADMVAGNNGIPERVAALGGELVRVGDLNDEKAVNAKAGNGKAGDLAGQKAGNIFKDGGRKARKITRRYNEEWFRKMAASLGVDEDTMKKWFDGEGKKFQFGDTTPEGNLTAFNDLYKTYQKDKALRDYIRGKREDKRKELFDAVRGLYRMSDDNSKVMKAKLDENGDRVLDDNGKVIWEAYDGTVDDLLNSFNQNNEFEDGFSWKDDDANVLRYAVEREKNPWSNLRYASIPIELGTLGYNLLTSPDYSRAEEVKKAGEYAPMMVRADYNPTYLKNEHLDPWFYTNPIMSASRAKDRVIQNSGASPGAKLAAQMANNYDTMLALGAAQRQGIEYNDAKDARVAAHNSGENKTLAQLSLESQLANQRAQQLAQQSRYQGIVQGNQMMDTIDAQRNAAINQGLTNLSTSLSNLGEEFYDEDRAKWLEDTGVFSSDYYGRRKYGAKYGGMLTKKLKS